MAKSFLQHFPWFLRGHCAAELEWTVVRSIINCQFPSCHLIFRLKHLKLYFRLNFELGAGCTTCMRVEGLQDSHSKSRDFSFFCIKISHNVVSGEPSGSTGPRQRQAPGKSSSTASHSHRNCHMWSPPQSVISINNSLKFLIHQVQEVPGKCGKRLAGHLWCQGDLKPAPRVRSCTAQTRSLQQRSMPLPLLYPPSPDFILLLLSLPND